MQQATSRHRSRVAPAGSPARGLPDFGRSLLEETLAGVGYRLYSAAAEAFTLLHASGLKLDPRDPWSIELHSPRVWEQAPCGDPIRLADLCGPAGHPAPDPSLQIRSLRENGRLRGGLLLHPPGGCLSGEAFERLRDPRLEAGLVQTIELANARREVSELRIFRQGVAGTLPYGILILDGLGRITYMGGRASQILGIAEVEAAGGDCARIFRPAGLESNPLLDGLRRPLPPMEMYVARPDGTEVPILLQMARIPGEGRSSGGRGVIAFFQDVTEERVLEETERHRDRLAVLGELSAGVAHEIRNPLTGIANCAQVLQEGMDPEDGRQRFLRIILEEAARLNRIVEGLLRYARPNRPELREGSIEECLRRVVELTRAELEKKGIRMTQRASGRIPRLFFDSPQIEQVLLNLVRNAEEAMPSGGEITLELSVVRRRPHRRRGTGRRATDRVRLHATEGPLQRFVQVKVSDTGHGIPKELLPRVFNPFFTTRKRGTGLGLSLSASIVREHGGLLTIRSVEKKGTTLLLELPVERRQGERRKESG